MSQTSQVPPFTPPVSLREAIPVWARIAALSAVGAAVVGVVLNLALWFGLFRVGVFPLLLACAAMGAGLHWLADFALISGF